MPRFTAFASVAKLDCHDGHTIKRYASDASEHLKALLTYLNVLASAILVGCG